MIKSRNGIENLFRLLDYTRVRPGCDSSDMVFVKRRNGVSKLAVETDYSSNLAIRFSSINKNHPTPASLIDIWSIVKKPYDRRIERSISTPARVFINGRKWIGYNYDTINGKTHLTLYTD